MSLPAATDILFVSNGHGEDAIAASILDVLAPDPERRARIAAWPQVGAGTRYLDRSIQIIGPSQSLPSEGFGTVSWGNFLRDLKAGFVGSYLKQIRFARTLRGNRAVMVAIGDVVPLAAGVLSGLKTIYYSAPKSAHYGGYDGHGGHERALMARCAEVFTRDALTADRLNKRNVSAQFLGNPVMDQVGGAPQPALRPQGRTVIALLPGSRADTATNTALLLTGLSAADTPVHGLIAAHDGFDPDSLRLPPGWTVTGNALTHDSGATGEVLKHKFSDILASSDIAVGMAGTANEQAAGLGLPLIALPGAGSQGPAFHRMKARYFGKAAWSIPSDPHRLGQAIDALINDPERCRDMGQAGKALMGPPGGSAAIAKIIAHHAGWETPK